jgi:hypothetical protein
MMNGGMAVPTTAAPEGTAPPVPLDDGFAPSTTVATPIGANP